MNTSSEFPAARVSVGFVGFIVSEGSVDISKVSWTIYIYIYIMPKNYNSELQHQKLNQGQ
jgi:hypothetical protein